MKKPAVVKFVACQEIEVNFTIPTEEESIEVSIPTQDEPVNIYWSLNSKSKLKVGIRWEDIEQCSVEGGLISLSLIYQQAFGAVVVLASSIYDSKSKKESKENSKKGEESVEGSGDMEIEASMSMSGYAYTSQVLYSLKIILDVTIQKAKKKQIIAGPSHCDIHSNQIFNNVRFFFPRSNQELWTNSASLIEAVPYYEDPLEHGWSEGTIRHDSGSDYSNSSSESSLCNSDSEEEFEEQYDSDDELENSKLKRFKIIRSHPLAPYKEIRVTEFSFKTFKALLYWIQTQEIHFSPLTSTLINCLSLPTKYNQSPPPPFTVSPKSIYILAHYLNLPSLQSLALQSLEAQISRNNIFKEVFSRIAVFSEVRGMLIEKLLNYWEEGLVESMVEFLEGKEGGGIIGSRAFGLVSLDLMRCLRV